MPQPREAHLQGSESRFEVGQVWQRQDGSQVRVQGFSKIDNPPWVKVREVGEGRERGAYPREAFTNGSFVLFEETR